MERAELVSTDDPNVDHNSLVFIDSDSEGASNFFSSDVQGGSAVREEVITLDDDVDDVSIDITEKPTTAEVKQEEESNIEGSEVVGAEADEVRTDLRTITFDIHDVHDITTIKEEDEYNFEASTSLGIIHMNPPSGICSPSGACDDEEQFELIPNESEKTELEEAEEVASVMNMSLADHSYHQPETTNREFCDDIVRGMLKDSGNDASGSVVKLLSMFTETLEHFVDEDPQSQISLYLQSMKKALTGLAKTETEKPPAETTILWRDNKMQDDDEPPAEVALKVEIEESKPKFEGIPLTEELSQLTNGDHSYNAIDLPATQPTDDEAANEDPVTAENEPAPVEKDEPAATEQEEPAPAEQEEPAESENIKKLHVEINQVCDFGKKLNDASLELLQLPNENDENVADIKAKLLVLVKESRAEYRKIAAEIEGKAARNLARVKKLKKTEADDSLSSTTSDSDDDIMSLNHKIPAVVSSTKQDSDGADMNESVAIVKSRGSTPESGSGAPNDIDKEINRLLDFASLENPKPASSKKKSKPKKVKPKKKPSSDIDSLLTSDDDSNAPAYSSTVSLFNCKLTKLLTKL